VAYRLNPLTHWLLRRIVKVKHVHLVNLILEREVVRELIQQHCNPELLAGEVERLLDEPALREAQLRACRQALQRLGLGELSPSRRAAEVVFSVIAARAPKPRLTAA
jgi:lipid-A-disaccharide synthase